MADDISSSGESASFGEVTLTPGWQQYTLGPLLVSSENADIDLNTATLFFNANNNAFIDNVTLREVEDVVYRVNGSWATPSTCDQTEGGLPAPQLHLGCQEYRDSDDATHTLKSFSAICREEAVGCEAFYDTRNSDTPYPGAYGISCFAPDVNGDGDPDAVTVQTSCTGPFGQEACTIAPGETSCLYDFEGPTSFAFDAVGGGLDPSGPASELVPYDEKIYLVDNPSYYCSAQAAGCTLLGNPTFDSREFVDGAFGGTAIAYEDAAFINDPDTYATTLCREEALFCEAWSNTENQLYYFRDPGASVCEYRNDVLIGGTRFDGWFEAGSDTPCYEDFLEDGTTYGIWRNGDADYTGLVGTCPDEQNFCSEFIDVVDTQEGSFPDGRTYYFLKNDKISEEDRPANQKCEGLISQKDGCVAFDDTTVPYHTFNASASYVRSVHADALDRLAPFASVTPVSCLNPAQGDGEFTLAGGDTVNLCERRCAYVVATSGTVDNPTQTVQLGDSCFVSDDCPVVQDAFGNTVGGVCANPAQTVAQTATLVDDGVCTAGINIGELCNAPIDCGTGGTCTALVFADRNLTDDSNTVMKVKRDRTCAEWLACDSEFTTWSEAQGKFINVCESVGLCNEFTNVGDTSFCSNWIDRSLELLSEDTYAARDATWFGLEYSGYSISNQYGVDQYDQINLNPTRWCRNVDADAPFNENGEVTEFSEITGIWSHGTPMACLEDQECADVLPSVTTLCEPAQPDYRLAVGVGPCLSGAQNGTACTVGVCEETGVACASDDQCTASLTDECVLITAQAKNGTCYSGQCVQTIDGRPLTLGIAEQNECRGYPEEDAPFPNELVTQWIDENDVPARDELFEWKPIVRRAGYDHANICANGEVCECSYKTAEYGNGVREQFFGTATDPLPAAICNGGQLDGADCSVSSADCTAGGGTCEYKSAELTHVGWKGYCIERDGSINILSDQNKEACLLWLPVDQLFGSTDLNNKFISAGFTTDDTAYCLATDVYVDVFTTPIACAESLRGEDFNTGVGPDGQCNADEWDSCEDQVVCPLGYYAIVGGCDDTALSQTCIQGGNDEDADDDCPFICVPQGSYRLEDDVEVACNPPSDAAEVVTVSHSEYSAWYPWSTTAYLVTHLSEEIADFPYEECVRKGVVPGLAPAAADNQYYPVTYGVDPDGDSDPAPPEWRSFVNAAQYYLACTRLAVTSAEQDLAYGNIPGNAAFTNRLLSPNFDNQYALDTDNVETAYVGQSDVRYGGRVQPSLEFVDDANTRVAANTGSVDVAPIQVAACTNGALAEESEVLSIRPADSSCLEPEYPETTNWARSYDYFEAELEDVGNAGGIGVDELENEGFSDALEHLKQFFGKIYSVWEYNQGALDADQPGENHGGYEYISASGDLDIRDVGDPGRGAGANNGTPGAPVVRALGTACVDDNCLEGAEDAFTLNGDAGRVFESRGSFRADVRFFATTDPNQFPLRNVIVDWGDGTDTSASSFSSVAASDHWGRGSQSGSDAPDNYYKAHRGLRPDQTPWCTNVSTETEWGLTSDSCEEGPFRFQHHYRCTPGLLNWINASGRTCEVDGEGHVGSPWDNPACFGADGSGECNQTIHPLPGGVLPNTPYSDPWVYYNGFVVVEP